jgi:SAM-dependent methyltransferase
MKESVFQIVDGIYEKSSSIIKVTFSSPASQNEPYGKIILRPILLKGQQFWQAEQYTQNKVFHKNMPNVEIRDWLNSAANSYNQICVFLPGQTITYSVPKNGMFKVSTSQNLIKSAPLQKNNREKDYILKEGENIPALVDLGVFTPDFKVVKSKYDKYKQINRFIQLIDDEFSSCNNHDITILDFGCGKSYLTFIIYYYFVHIKNMDATIIGYDLKQDVVDNCNAIAKKYGYKNLQFVVSDVSKDVLYDRHIDMIVSLHACDTATDYALQYAIKKNVKTIFSVPCCQHEVNFSIKRGGELDIFLKYGIVKERMSALLTDTIRALLLEDMGYSVDLIEFVDFENSPKNLMIRAKKTKLPSNNNREKIAKIIEQYSIKQTLFELLKKDF